MVLRVAQEFREGVMNEHREAKKRGKESLRKTPAFAMGEVDRRHGERVGVE